MYDGSAKCPKEVLERTSEVQSLGNSLLKIFFQLSQFFSEISSRAGEVAAHSASP
jgi:hypothetical protein